MERIRGFCVFFWYQLSCFCMFCTKEVLQTMAKIYFLIIYCNFASDQIRFVKHLKRILHFDSIVTSFEFVNSRVTQLKALRRRLPGSGRCPSSYFLKLKELCLLARRKAEMLEKEMLSDQQFGKIVPPS